MRQGRLHDMVGGWFVGDFSPSLLRSKECEVAVKSYAAGDRESAHRHLVATEVTLILDGRAVMCGREFGPGDIVVLDPGEATAFEALTELRTVVVKLPSVAGDKYPVEPGEA